jgi:hypothetical protein
MESIECSTSDAEGYAEMLRFVIENYAEVAPAAFEFAATSATWQVRAMAMSQLWELAAIDYNSALKSAVRGCSDGQEGVRSHAFRAWMSILAYGELRHP